MVRYIYNRRAILLALFFFTSVSLTRAQSKPNKEYLVYVVSESADKMALIRFGQNGIRIDRQIDTGDMPVDIDGPHGIVVSPERKLYCVTNLHGCPFGFVCDSSVKPDTG